MKKFIFGFLLLTSYFFFFASFASFAKDSSSSSYFAEVPIAGYSDAERDAAFAEAFKKAVIEKSGDTKNLNDAQIKAKLKNISSWVQSYNYAKHLDATGTPTLFLQINFDPRSIPHELHQPEGTNETTDKDISNKDVHSLNDIERNLNEEKQELQDQHTLPANRFSGSEQIAPSSLGIPRGGEERATGMYGFIHDCRERRSQQSGKPKCEGYMQKEGEKATSISSSPPSQTYKPETIAPLPLTNNKAVLYITNINNLEQYAAAVKYLRSFSPITKIELLNINGQTVKLLVTIKGSKNNLSQLLNQDAQHKFTSAPISSAVDNHENQAPENADNNSTNTDTANDANALSYTFTQQTS